ncbi:glycoside hydrolase [Mesobaculum littorinae]|uniref:Glycoside hydrolase n=1 Tax=Mesobaculum littorinae TaxID=2486419 RepID=A0A438ADJ0_9RHOB|nr:GH25 family lysozyme [Mesobaculum littorinae]RVV96763.1 glycoside hydrolase [Mesobaculum littorinae]
MNLTRRAACFGLTSLAACGPRERAAPVTLPGRVPQPGAVRPPRFGDRDPVTEWSGGPAPSSYAVHGIDASKFQGTIDWRAAGASGVNFAFLKATEGGDRIDPLFAENFAGAAAAGVPVGGYHFYYFCNSPEVQARWFIQNVPRIPGALPPVLDLEWNPFSPTCVSRPPQAEVRRVAETWLSIVSRHYQQRPIVYVPLEFWRDRDVRHLPADYWLRSVAKHPDEAFADRSWTFWQYSGTGQVPGVSGNCDLNVFGGGASLWRRWLAARRHG